MSLASRLAAKSDKTSELLRDERMQAFIDMLVVEATKQADTTAVREITRCIGRADHDYRRVLEQRLVQDGLKVVVFFNCTSTACEWGCLCKNNPNTEWLVRISW